MKHQISEKVENNYIINGIHLFSSIPNTVYEIIIYVHGLGSDKSWAKRFYKQLNDNNIGIISYDQICHGEDNCDYIDFDLANCIDYLDKVIKYVKEKYNCKICLFGSSFGGFVILNKLLQSNDNYKTILMCPAINFWDIIKIKTGIKDDYFLNNEYLPLYSDIKIFKQNYLQFKIGNEKIKNNKFSNIYIIHGTRDNTVKYSDIVSFCNKNKLRLKTIKNGKHELYGYEDEIVNYINNIV